MIKKLNSNRFTTERKLPGWNYDEDTSDFTKIDIQLYDIKFRLDGLKGSLLNSWFFQKELKRFGY